MNDKIKWTLEQAMDARDRIANVIDLLEGQSAAQEAEEAPRPGKWVSVKDELPRAWVSVLAYVRRKKARYRVIVWRSDVKGWGSHDPFFDKRDKVTHWMPLPEPPEEID